MAAVKAVTDALDVSCPLLMTQMQTTMKESYDEFSIESEKKEAENMKATMVTCATNVQAQNKLLEKVHSPVPPRLSQQSEEAMTIRDKAMEATIAWGDGIASDREADSRTGQ